MGLFGNQANLKAVITAEDRSGHVLQGFGNKVNSTSQAMAGAVRKTSLALIAATTAAVTFAVKSASEFEQSRVAFDTMLGSAEKGRKIMKDLSEFARRTPFELPEVVEGAKKLLAYGISAENVMEDLKTLGDISAGVGREKLPMLTLAFGQVATKGKLFGQEIRQFTEAGVPLIEELSKSLGYTKEQIIKMSEEGQISFGDVRDALEKMTGEGGKFFNLMDRQSKTFGGVMSNIRDQIGRTARSIVGISEEGDIREGSIFAKLSKAGQELLNWLNSNSGQITEKTQDIVDRMIKVSEEFGKKFINNVKSDGFASAFSQALIEMLGKVNWSGFAQAAVGLFVQITPQIISGFVKGLIDAATQKPLNFIGLFLALGFIPKTVLLALTTVLSGIPMVGPILAWVTKGFASAAVLAKGPVSAAMSALGSTAAGAVATGFVSSFAVAGGVIVSTISSVRGVVNGEIKKLTSQTQPLIDRLRSMGKNDEANKLQNTLSQVQKGPGGPFKFLPFAKGTDFAPGGMALVGEEGPELVNLPRGSKVIPNDKLNTGSNINLSVNVGVYTGSEIEKRKLAKMLLQAMQDIASSQGMTLNQMMGN